MNRLKQQSSSLQWTGSGFALEMKGSSYVAIQPASDQLRINLSSTVTGCCQLFVAIPMSFLLRQSRNDRPPSLTLSRPDFFWAPLARGTGHTLCPLSKTMFLLYKEPTVKFFWKLVRSFVARHTFFFSIGTVLSVLRWLKGHFLQKPQTKDTVQMAIVLVFNKSSNTKIGLYTYLRLTLNQNYVGWA